MDRESWRMENVNTHTLENYYHVHLIENRKVIFSIQSDIIISNFKACIFIFLFAFYAYQTYANIFQVHTYTDQTQKLCQETKYVVYVFIMNYEP